MYFFLINTVFLNLFLSNSFISTAKDVFPVPPALIFPTQIVFILNFFLKLIFFFKKLILKVINVKGNRKREINFFCLPKIWFFENH